MMEGAAMTLETHRGYLNIYRSGVWHSCGKPGAFDRHGGDLYPTPQAAEAAISPRSHFIATVVVEWYELDGVVPNPVPGELNGTMVLGGSALGWRPAEIARGE